MYAQQQLGDLGLPAGASQAISTTVSAVSNYAAASVTAGALVPLTFGSMAGPIGAVIGAVVSALMMLFGGKDPKKPVFGIVALIPDAENEKITVGRMLAILNKRMINFGWGRSIPASQWDSVGATIAAQIRAEPAGILAVTSGGLPTAHTEVTKLDFAKIQTYSAGLALPFKQMLDSITDQDIKAAILASPLPYQSSNSYYFQMREEKPGKEAPANSTSVWMKNGISQTFDAVKIVGGQALGGSMDRGLKAIPENINEIFISLAGVDVIAGIIVDQVKADKAFKPASGLDSVTDVISGLTSSPVGLLLLAGGLLVFLRR